MGKPTDWNGHTRTSRHRRHPSKAVHDRSCSTRSPRTHRTVTSPFLQLAQLAWLRMQNNLNLHAGTVRKSTRPRRTVHIVFANTAGRWATSSAGETVADEHMASKVTDGITAATEFFGKVPNHYRWMFDSNSLREAFVEGDERPAKEQRFSQARTRL